MTENRAAGLIIALSTLVVVSAMAMVKHAHDAPALVVVPVRHVPGQREEPAPKAVRLPERKLSFPLKGYDPARLRDTFDESRGRRKHEALDIMAPRGTPVVAVDDGRVARLYRSGAGGLSVYQFDAAGRLVYFYAHLDGYAAGLAEGDFLKRGDLVGYVGSTGNAPRHAPHLHFAIFEMGPERKWWKGRAINPYEYLK